MAILRIFAKIWGGTAQALYNEVMQMTRNSDIAESLLHLDCVLTVKNEQCTVTNLLFLQTKFGIDPTLQVTKAIREGKTSFEDLRDLSVEALANAIETQSYPTQNVEQHSLSAARNVHSMFRQSTAAAHRQPSRDEESPDITDATRHRPGSPGSDSEACLVLTLVFN